MQDDKAGSNPIPQINEDDAIPIFSCLYYDAFFICATSSLCV